MNCINDCTYWFIWFGRITIPSILSSLLTKLENVWHFASTQCRVNACFQIKVTISQGISRSTTAEERWDVWRVWGLDRRRPIPVQDLHSGFPWWLPEGAGLPACRGLAGDEGHGSHSYRLELLLLCKRWFFLLKRVSMMEDTKNTWHFCVFFASLSTMQAQGLDVRNGPVESWYNIKYDVGMHPRYVIFPTNMLQIQ